MKVSGPAGRKKHTANVYRLHGSDGRLLYVGCSTEVQHRIATHLRRAPWRFEIAWWEIDAPMPTADALVDERRQILALNPIHNINRHDLPTELAAVEGITVFDPAADDESITTAQALRILGLRQASSISRYVASGKLVPSRKLPGRTGARLFWRRDVERLATEQAAAKAGAAS